MKLELDLGEEFIELLDTFPYGLTQLQTFAHEFRQKKQEIRHSSEGLENNILYSNDIGGATTEFFYHLLQCKSLQKLGETTTKIERSIISYFLKGEEV